MLSFHQDYPVTEYGSRAFPPFQSTWGQITGRSARESLMLSSWPGATFGSGRGDDQSPDMSFRYRLTVPVGFDHVSDALARATGYPTTDYYSNPEILSFITVREDRPLLDAFLGGARAVARPVKLRWMRKNGTILVVELRARQIFDEDGNVVALDVTAREILDTRRMDRHVNDANTRLRAALDFSNDGIGILFTRQRDDGKGDDFVWEYANRTALRLLEVEASELIGSSVTSKLAGTSGDDLLRYLRDATEPWTAGQEQRLPLLLGNGLAMSASRLDDGVVVRIRRAGDPASTLASIRAAEISDRIYGAELPVRDQFLGIAEALIAIGTDFALIVAGLSNPREQISIVRTSPRIKHRSETEKVLSRWIETVTGQCSGGVDGCSHEGQAIQVSSRGRSQKFVMPPLDLLNLEHLISPSSLHVIPVPSASGQPGAIVFGTTAEHAPLSSDQLRLARLLARPATNAIEIDDLRSERKLAAEAREQFMSTVAHEIRTPLTAIRGYTQLLNRHLNRDEPDIVRARRAAKGLRTQINRFLSLAEDLLDAARIHHGRLDLRLEDADMSRLAQDAVERLNTMIGASGRVVNADLDMSLPGVWDTARIDQVLFIVLSNAVKYSHDGEVRLSAWREGDRVFVQVTDHGVGIEPSEVETLFEPFERGQSAPVMSDGWGLGLYLAREIVEHHGGHIAIGSQPGIGTTVTVELPVRATDPSSIK